MPEPEMRHPTTCKKKGCGGQLKAIFNITKSRTVNKDGTLGKWGSETRDLDYYTCGKCGATYDLDGNLDD